MDRERLGRRLALALVPLGVAMVGLGLAVGALPSAIIGGVAIVAGALLYANTDLLFDPSIEPDLTTADARRGTLVQLGLVLVVFALLVFLLGDGTAVQDFLEGAVPVASGVAAVLAGLLLGGGTPVLVQRSEAVAAASQSPGVRAVGFSLTFGVMAGLLLVAPAASVVYAATYAVSRVVVLAGIGRAGD